LLYNGVWITVSFVLISLGVMGCCANLFMYGFEGRAWGTDWTRKEMQPSKEQKGGCPLICPAALLLFFGLHVSRVRV